MALVEFVVEVVGNLLFGWIPERPRWARWLVSAIYLGLIGCAIALIVLSLA